MTMRLDIVSNDAGEQVRREQSRDLGAGVVVAIYRLAKLAQMHNLTNQAFVQQLDSTHQAISDYCMRSGATQVNILFAQRAVFVAGQLLKGSRQTYEQASDLGEICEWLGGSELVIAREITREELHAFAEAVSAAMRSEKGSFQSPTPRVRLRAVADAARLRGLEIEDMPQEQRIVRAYASAVVILRRFFEDLHGSKYILPRRIKRVAQTLVDLSDGNNAAFLGVTEARNANHDEAGRAVNSAILAVTVARQVTQDRIVLSQIAMASMMHDVARPRALALSAAAMASMGAMSSMGAMAPSLSEEQEDRLAAGAAAVLTALGRVNEPSITRTVVAFEALWLRRQQWLGTVYRGIRAPTIHARIMWIARRYNDLMTPEPGLLPPTPDYGIAQLADELKDPQDKTVLRMLVASLGTIPMGTVVQLSTGEVGEVIRGTVSAEDKPLVRLSLDASGAMYPQPIELDLGRPPERGQPARTVTRVLSIDGWKKALEQRRAQEPQAHGGHAAEEYDEAPAWESMKPPAPPPPAPSQPSAIPAKLELQTAVMNDPPERSTSPAPRNMSIDINADAFTVPPPPITSSMLPEPDDSRPSSPVPLEENSSAEPISTSGVSASIGTSPSMVGRDLGWYGPPEPGAKVQEERTLFQASSRESPAVERASSRGPEPTARGDLASTPLAHVLVYMLDHALTGTVVFYEGNGTEHTVYFIRGIPAKVRLGFDFAMLGELLARAEAIGENQIDHYVEGAQRLGVLLGEYLVGHDVVSREMLAWVLETQVLEKVSGLANLSPETTYAYYRDINLLDGWGGELSLSGPLNAVLAVVRAWDDRSRIRATLNRIGKHPLTFHEESDTSGLILSDEEVGIIELLNRERLQLAELFRRQVADEDVVSALIYTMAVTRQFNFKGQKKGPMASRGSAPRPRPDAVSATSPAPAPAPAPPAPAPAAASSSAVKKKPVLQPPAAAQAAKPPPLTTNGPKPAPARQPPTASPKPPAAQPPSISAIAVPSPSAPQSAPAAAAASMQPRVGTGAKLTGPAIRPVVKGTIQGLHPRAIGQILASPAGQPSSNGPASSPTGAGPGRPAISKLQAAAPAPASSQGASSPKIPIDKSPSGPKIGPPAQKIPADRGSSPKLPGSTKLPAANLPGPPQIQRIAPPNNSATSKGPAPNPLGAPKLSGGPKLAGPQIRPIANPLSVGKIPAAAPIPKGAAAGPPSQRTPLAPPVKPVQVKAAPPPPPPPSSPSTVPPTASPTTPPGADAEDGTLAIADTRQLLTSLGAPPDSSPVDVGDAGGDPGLEDAELAIEAMTNFRLADTALQRNDLANAERLARQAVDGDASQPEYKILLAWVQQLRANSDGASKTAIDTISKLLDDDPSNERGLLYRGRLHKKLGNAARALEDFQAVVEVNPGHREAQAEIRGLKKK